MKRSVKSWRLHFSTDLYLIGLQRFLGMQRVILGIKYGV